MLVASFRVTLPCFRQKRRARRCLAHGATTNCNVVRPNLTVETKTVTSLITLVQTCIALLYHSFHLSRKLAKPARLLRIILLRGKQTPHMLTICWVAGPLHIAHGQISNSLAIQNRTLAHNFRIRIAVARGNRSTRWLTRRCSTKSIPALARRYISLRRCTEQYRCK